MNAFDRHRKNFTAWCEDCDQVFDNKWLAEAHKEQQGHQLKITEFWITSR